MNNSGKRDGVGVDEAQGVQRLADLVRAGTPDAISPVVSRRGHDAVVAKLVAARVAPAGSRTLRWLAPVAVVGAAAAVALVLWGPAAPGEPLLVASVEGSRAPLAEGSEVRAPASAAADIVFSDGTRLSLARSARTRLGAIGRKGARVRLEEGRAQVKVVPRPKHDGEWLFSAGPCEVQVTGTSFDLDWSSARQRFELDLHTGSVIVRSPAKPGGVALKAGQRLVFDGRSGLAIQDVRNMQAAATEAAAGAPPVAQPAEAAAPILAPEEAPSVDAIEVRSSPRSAFARMSAHEPANTWSALADAGRYGRILREARRLGLDAAIDRAEGADLHALGQAARFTGDARLARRAFLAVHTRYPRSSHGRRAAYFLGLVAEDMDKRRSEALEWYDTYLQSEPKGPLAGLALARKMTALVRMRNLDAARAAAAEYLRRFPEGDAAAAAGRLVQRP